MSTLALVVGLSTVVEVMAGLALWMLWMERH